MRLLVACSACNRQYDAIGYRVGSRFHCHCGQVMIVEQPAPHEAAVVRCSGCGAPRSTGPDCEHCGSIFAAYERDMTSCCPHCVTRISDQARFCHSCGCAGLWLGPDIFPHVIRRAEEMVADIEAHSPAPRPPASIGDQPVSYRPCPVCKSLMQRSQYGKYSRVVIDTCRHHGVWLDEGELHQILEWVRSGGLDRSRKAVHEARIQELRKQQFGLRGFLGVFIQS